jgi:NAD(P)-dependent dehydrogenase (short-subunit alcohol dehydrogenase family)
MDRLTGKVILVAGGGGIGNGLAIRYAAEGANVILGDTDVTVAQTAVDEIVAAGGSAVATLLDGADESSVEAAIALAVDTFGGLDGLHANFASFLEGEANADLLGTPLDMFDEVMRVNARGFTLCTKLVLPHLLERGGGAIVYTSSGAAHAPQPGRVAYGMSKAAIHSLVRHVALRFGPQGVRANAIAPGVIAHKRFWEVMPPEYVDAMKAEIPMRRLGTPEDIAALGALLLSDEGSFINGQVISVDGGGSMRL